MGYYSDALFGDVEAVGMVKPVRRPTVIDTDSIELGNFSMQLQITLDSLNTYGDTLSQSSFTLYPITSNWRGRAFRFNSELTYDESRPVASFSIGQEDSILTEQFSQDWVDEYEVYLNDSSLDSAYKYDFKGLAIVPDNNSSKISYAAVASTRFLIINESQGDTVNTGLTDWAYQINRSGAVMPPIVNPVHTSLEAMTSITLDSEAIRAFVEGKNLIRAELQIHEAREELQRTLPANHNRLAVNSLNIDLAVDADPEYEYQFGQVEFVAARVDSSSRFKANLTSYVNNIIYGDEDREEMILGLGSSSGVLRSTLIYNETAPDSLVPKLIFTSIADE